MVNKVPKLTVQLIAAIAISLAMVMVIENYFSVRLSDTLQLQFTFIPHAILGAIAGPIVGAVVAAITDPVFVLFSGQTMILGFVFIEAVSAFLYGWFFYGKRLDIQNKKDWYYIIGAVIVIQVVISFIMTPIVLHFHFGTPWAVLYASRFVKAIFEVPMRVVVIMLVMPALQRIPEFRKLMGLKK